MNLEAVFISNTVAILNLYYEPYYLLLTVYIFHLCYMLKNSQLLLAPYNSYPSCLIFVLVLHSWEFYFKNTKFNQIFLV